MLTRRSIELEICTRNTTETDLKLEVKNKSQRKRKTSVGLIESVSRMCCYTAMNSARTQRAWICMSEICRKVIFDIRSSKQIGRAFWMRHFECDQASTLMRSKVSWYLNTRLTKSRSVPFFWRLFFICRRRKTKSSSEGTFRGWDDDQTWESRSEQLHEKVLIQYSQICSRECIFVCLW